MSYINKRQAKIDEVAMFLSKEELERLQNSIRSPWFNSELEIAQGIAMFEKRKILLNK